MLSVLHELRGIEGGGGREYASPMSEEEEKERGRKYTPERARQIHSASSICIVVFSFSFLLLLSFVCERE